MGTAVTEKTIEIDDEVLAEAAKFLGTTTDEETVNAALRELMERVRRMEAFERLREVAATGQFDELLDKKKFRS